MLTETTLEKIIKTGPGFHEFKRKAPVESFPDDFSRMITSYGETYFWEKGNFHVVTRAEDARKILTSPDYSADRGSFFVSRMPRMDLTLIQDFFGVVKKMMVMSDDQDHLKRRKAAAAGFEDHILEAFEDKMKKTVRALVFKIKNKTRVEFVDEVSRNLPSVVLADLFSIPEEDRTNFISWSNIMTGFFGGASAYENEDGVAVNEAARSLKEYFLQLIEDRTQHPGSDYVSIMLKMKEVMGLTTDEVLSQLIMMLVAGMATTTDQINNIIFLLGQRPELQDEAKSNPEIISKIIEEGKRYDPAVTFIFRVARSDTFIGNQPIKAGEVVFISTHAINRDLPATLKPFEFDITRKVPHFAYGHGPHYCIGAKLGRMEMNFLLEEMIKELPVFTLDSERGSIRDHYSLSFSGFKELHLKF